MCQALVWGDFPGCQLFFLASSELLSMAAFLTRPASENIGRKLSVMETLSPDILQGRESSWQLKNTNILFF